MIAREIVKADASYWGYFKVYIGSAQIRFAPKKYELYFDRAAVDLMVKSGYNPIGMISFCIKYILNIEPISFLHQTLPVKELCI